MTKTEEINLSVIFDAFLQIFIKMYHIYAEQFPIVIGLALFFSILTLFKDQMALPGKVWWRNPSLRTDFIYMIVGIFIGSYTVIPFYILFLFIINGNLSQEIIKNYFENPTGPLSHFPLWVQGMIYLILSDFLLYWIHRSFHTPLLWRFHAPHHAPQQVDWTTSYRFHPVNLFLQPTFVGVVMVFLGISPEVMAFFVPWDVFSAPLVHANVRWTFGPLKYVLASPVFHRWHHGLDTTNGQHNFAPTFSFFDLIFGTFSMPDDRGPTAFGIDDPDYPTTYLGELIAPLRIGKSTVKENGGG